LAWDQIHIFLDIAATVGGISVSIVGFLFKTGFKNASEDIQARIEKLEKDLAVYEATCSAERRELYRMVENFTND
jgi:hypothetical protein